MGENIELILSINETNAILFALAKQPYDTVAQLIEKIRAQALPQVPADQRNDEQRQDMAAKLAPDPLGPVKLGRKERRAEERRRRRGGR